MRSTAMEMEAGGGAGLISQMMSCCMLYICIMALEETSW